MNFLATNQSVILVNSDRNDVIIISELWWSTAPYFPNKQWSVADEGEFSNIKTNPLWQIKKFTPVKGRYIKLVATRNTQENDAVDYAEIDVITK